MQDYITWFMAETTDRLIPTRTTLIRRLKDWKDESSWQDFFDTYWKLIFGIALKGGLSQTEAQDVVQETMVSIARQMPRFKYDRSLGSFKAWLLHNTRWRIADHLRKRSRLAALPSFSDETGTGTRALDKVADPKIPDLEALWDAEWEKNLVASAVARVKRRLDPQKYQIFDLYVNKRWSPDKVAATFGVSVSQVYVAKHRASEMIKEEIERLRTQIL